MADHIAALMHKCAPENIPTLRPVLGGHTHMVVYRMFQQTLRQVFEAELGADRVDALFREAGTLAGRAFYAQFCGSPATLTELFKVLSGRFIELGVGIVRVEFSDPEGLEFALTVSEDLDCSGLEDAGRALCVYSEGMLQGILETYTGQSFAVEEVDCWGTGAKMCRFLVKRAS